MEYHRGGIFLTGLVMNAVQNETLKNNHWVNHVAPVHISNGLASQSTYTVSM